MTKLTENEMNDLYKFVAKKATQFDPSKGSMEYYMKHCIYWWFKELAEGRQHGRMDDVARPQPATNNRTVDHHSV